jgi:hypothetical protein
MLPKLRNWTVYAEVIGRDSCSKEGFIPRSLRLLRSMLRPAVDPVRLVPRSPGLEG